METKKVLLVTDTVMHYRVSVYNYFLKRFKEENCEFEVLTNQLEPQNSIVPHFNLTEMPLGFRSYRKAILHRKPDAIILFLHLKNPIMWLLVHWLKLARIPVVFWTKTRNLDDPNNRFRNLLFNYMMWLHDGLILYSADLLKNVPKRERHKAFPANNTLNFEDFPVVKESKEEIKRQLAIPFGKVVLFAGRMGVEGGRKRVDHLIEIFRDVEGRDVGLVIVGSGMKAEWKARMNPKTTVYLGEIHDPSNYQISRIFKMSDVCAIPGHVGLSLNQAFYFGLPVVTEEGLHPPEIGYLKHGRNGFIVPQNNLVALKAKIFELLDNEALLQTFSNRAMSDILTEASTERMFCGFRDCVEFCTQQYVQSH
jgi:glycosyltransferase involved in cell wall biosynthesis